MDKRELSRVSSKVETPCVIVDERIILSNLKILDRLQKDAGCKILLALKAYAMSYTFPLIREYLNGVCASGLYEAKLGHDTFRKEVHTYSPAFSGKDFDEIMGYSDHIVFNSAQQLHTFRKAIFRFNRKHQRQIKIGLRVNPEISVASRYEVYDPCSQDSRLGIRESEFPTDYDGVSGLHFHALCEQDSADLEKVLNAFEKRFGAHIRKMQWVNFGGGHHITRKGYDLKKLVSLIRGFRKRFPNIQEVYLEPGEAVVLNAGFFVTQVLDVVHSRCAIVDASVETHFPDILITSDANEPYRPTVLNSGSGHGFPHEYLIGGISCAAGDVLGKYSFKNKLRQEDRLVFLDAAHYSMVKMSTFNGVPLPSYYVIKPNGSLHLVKKFSYDDFRERLA